MPHLSLKVSLMNLPTTSKIGADVSLKCRILAAWHPPAIEFSFRVNEFLETNLTFNSLLKLDFVHSNFSIIIILFQLLLNAIQQEENMCCFET